MSHTPNTPNSASSTVTPVRRERLLGGSVYGSQRSLWCELPGKRGNYCCFITQCFAEVKEAGLLDQMDGAEKKLQEAYFEVSRAGGEHSQIPNEDVPSEKNYQSDRR